MNSHLFLPFIGEVGWLVMWHMRKVHFTESRRKIVCCQRGQECLFPTADEFFYDWKDPVPDINRGGANPLGACVPHEFRRIPSAFPNCICVENYMSQEDEIKPVRPGEPINLSPKIRGLNVDVCIGVRNRQFMPTKNYRGWHEVAKWLKRHRITFAVIGMRQSSYALDGMDYMSGDLGDWDAAVELLGKCKLFIGTDSGAAHLCSVVGKCPMIVQNVPKPPTDYKMNWGWVHRMRLTTKQNIQEIGVDRWEDPQAMIDAIDSHFSQRTVAHEHRAHTPAAE